jgi:hypothetical protein
VRARAIGNQLRNPALLDLCAVDHNAFRCIHAHANLLTASPDDGHVNAAIDDDGFLYVAVEYEHGFL